MGVGGGGGGGGCIPLAVWYGKDVCSCLQTYHCACYRIHRVDPFVRVLIEIADAHWLFRTQVVCCLLIRHVSCAERSTRERLSSERTDKEHDRGTHL